MNPFSIQCVSPILVAEFSKPQAILSWSLTRPGFTTARKVAWLHVRDDDLPLNVDPAALLEAKMTAAGHADAIHLMTSRDIGCHYLATATSGSVIATCLATVGLGNVARVGTPPLPAKPIGTINLLAHVNRPLSQGAMLEAVSIVTEARTTAIIDLCWKPRGEIVTGTGTDCIVVATPIGGRPEQFAGLHTDIGAALGRAVCDAVSSGGHAWIAEQAAIGSS